MMRGFIKTLVTVSVCALVFGCSKSTASGDTVTPDQVKELITKAIPSLPKIDSVNKSPITGMYEVVSGSKVYYVTTDGKYLVFGNIIEVNSRKSLTAERIQQITHPAGK